MSRHAFYLKLAWMEMSDESFETLTFGELKIGQQFIALPEPGDNHGHGGLKEAHCLFRKTQQKVLDAGNDFPYATPHGRAVEIKSNIGEDIYNAMPVVLIE